MYSLDVSTEGSRFGNTCMASLGSYGAPIQTQCQYPTLKRDPLVKVKRSPVWSGFWFCCHYIDISNAASPVTFLKKKLSACKPQGVISHGVISIIFDLFVYCLPVLVNAQWATSPPACGILGHCGVPEEPWNICPSVFRGLCREARQGDRAGLGQGTLSGQAHWHWPSHRGMKKLWRVLVPGWRSSHGDALLRLLCSNGRFCFLHWSWKRNLSLIPLGLASPGERSSLKMLQPTAIRLCSLWRKSQPLSLPSSGRVWPWFLRLQNQARAISLCPGEMLCPLFARVFLQGFPTSQLWIHKAGWENKLPRTPFIAKSKSKCIQSFNDQKERGKCLYANKAAPGCELCKSM